MRMWQLSGVGVVVVVCAGCGASSQDVANAPDSAADYEVASASGNAIAMDADRAGDTEEYTDYGVNAFVDPAQDPLSTFSVDVDTASFTIARRKINEGTLPPFEAVRVEEFLNYFDFCRAHRSGAQPLRGRASHSACRHPRAENRALRSQAGAPRLLGRHQRKHAFA